MTTLTTTTTMTTISVPLERVATFSSTEYWKRFRKDVSFHEFSAGDFSCAHRVIFYPPNYTALWPKTIGDISNDHIKKILETGGQDAVAVAIDGIVYTDDTPFWLGKVTLNSECHIVYEKREGDQEIWGRVARHPWYYIEDFPAFHKPADDTRIEYLGIRNWNEYKKRNCRFWETTYGEDGVLDGNGLTHPPTSYREVDNWSDPPPPYRP